MRHTDRTLSHWIGRPLQNTGDLVAWAKEQGFQNLVPEAWHVTIARPTSRTAVALDDCPVVISAKGRRQVSRFGGLIALEFSSLALTARHHVWLGQGARQEFRRFKPHISFTPDDGRDLNCVTPFRGELSFGPETSDEDMSF